MQEALYHGFWFRAQKVLAILEGIYVDKCSLLLCDSGGIDEICGNVFIPFLGPCDFLEQWSQGVSMSRHQNICAPLCRALDDEHPVRCLST